MPFKLAEAKHPFLVSQLCNHYKETNNFILVFDWLDGTFSFSLLEWKLIYLLKSIAMIIAWQLLLRGPWELRDQLPFTGLTCCTRIGSVNFFLSPLVLSCTCFCSISSQKELLENKFLQKASLKTNLRLASPETKSLVKICCSCFSGNLPLCSWHSKRQRNNILVFCSRW